MIHIHFRARARIAFLSASAVAVLANCSGPLDYDLRGIGGGFSTADAATQVATEARPQPDNRGIISYPNYQVAVASRGDTINSVAQRLNLDAASLARFNGIDQNLTLRQGEIIALPTRVAEPSAQTGAIISGPIQPGSVDIGAIAGGAIDRSENAGARVQTAALPPADNSTTAPAPSSGKEPVRHKVKRGETAFTIARLYDVPVQALAEWNGLGSDYTIREGQYLLIPVAAQASAAPASSVVSKPGVGSETPTPPSATKPLPSDSSAVPVAQTPTEPAIDIGERTEQSDVARMVYPVSGTIIRDYAKGRNEGINIKAAAGAPVKAADAGTVAAITKSAEGIPIIVVRHEPELLTVYANVSGVAVDKGDTVKRGQQIAQLRGGQEAYVHFEVRQGFDAVDPMLYLK